MRGWTNHANTKVSRSKNFAFLSLRLGPAPPASSSLTHKVMVSNRGSGTRLEKDFCRALRGAGFNGFRVNYAVGNARVDIAFPSKRVAIQVNGCFWHHCPVCKLPIPKTNSEFWATKFELTRARDARVRKLVRQNGWKLVELWEHQVRGDLEGCLRRVKATTPQVTRESSGLGKRQEQAFVRRVD
jgi:DNA mismatch endonuclease, patch repair protein